MDSSSSRDRRSPQFYRDLADDARLRATALKDAASRSLVEEVAAAFDAAADELSEERWLDRTADPFQ